jgi:dephospho-CoA kinase
MTGGVLLILGLTGSIGMGKSTTAAMFGQAGVPVFDSDAAVHALYRGEAVPLVAKAFPGVVVDGVVDRQQLGRMVLGAGAAMQRLESIVHPLVRERERAFRHAAVQNGRRLLVLDIPLLFETEGEARADVIVVVTASEAVQKQRVLQRPGMTEEKLAAIMARQVPDAEKRRRAHALIDTGRGFDVAARAIADLLRALAPLA